MSSQDPIIPDETERKMGEQQYTEAMLEVLLRGGGPQEEEKKEKQKIVKR